MFILAINYKTIFKNGQIFTSYVAANDSMGFTHKQLAEYHIAGRINKGKLILSQNILSIK